MNSEFAAEFLSQFHAEHYPAELLQTYEPIECLGKNAQGETLLLRQRDSETLYVAKCYAREQGAATADHLLARDLEHPGIPKFAGVFENEQMRCVVRKYCPGVSLAQFVQENTITTAQIISYGTQLCDILTFLHHREHPIIHRDLKPQNVIINDQGEVNLIDFGIARIYDSTASNDTEYFGTQAFAPPEQYGFSQTDCRSDIFSLGVVLCWVLTRETDPEAALPKVENRALAKVLRRCTAFDPKNRYADADEVKRGLLNARPEVQSRRRFLAGVGIGVLLTALIAGGVFLYQKLTYSPFTDEGYVNNMAADEKAVAASVEYLYSKHGNAGCFDDTEAYMTVGLAKDLLSDWYGFDAEYAHAVPNEEGAPHESDHNFMPWGMGDEQYVSYQNACYIAVKIFDPAFVADWSSLKDDNGYYPGCRVAQAFVEENKLNEGVARPLEITKGEFAILLANTEQYFSK